MKNSNIEWTDHTFNPWECSKVSPGCAHCYAENRNARFGGGTAPNWGPGAPRRRTSAANWRQPLLWDRKRAWEVSDAEACGRDPGPSPRVFCASLADWLDDEVPVEWLADLLDLIRRTPNLDWLLLTKRPKNWEMRIDKVTTFLAETRPDDASGTPHDCTQGMVHSWTNGVAPENVWLGTTVEDQQRADERIPILLSIPARVRFLSCEPLIGPVDLMSACDVALGSGDSRTVPAVDGIGQHIHWVICGGESGRKARPMHPDWARSLRDQCDAAGVAFFFKQWGEHDASGKRVGKPAAGRTLDDCEHNAFPPP